MPLVRIATNKPLSEETPESLARALSTRVSETLGKPEKYVQVIVDTPAAILFGGSDEPSAFLEIKSIGALEPERVRTLSRELCELILRELEIPPERVYIEFTDVNAAMWGWNSTTFG